MQVFTILPIIPYTQSLAMESVRDFFVLLTCILTSIWVYIALFNSPLNLVIIPLLMCLVIGYFFIRWIISSIKKVHIRMADIIANQAYYLSKSGKINELKQKMITHFLP